MYRDVDKVNDIMDDIVEQQDIATEISGAITSPIGGIDVDEDELLNELEALEQEALNEKLVNVCTPTSTHHLVYRYRSELE